jgi:hypothetical protein
MTKKVFHTDLETVGKEIVENLKHTKNATLLIIGTESDEGLITRIFCNNPGKVAGILFTHAIDTGDFKTINEMIFHLRRIADVTSIMIDNHIAKTGRKN